ncbi:MAG TPA: cyclopropane-fatty-acyl-phospholipid synthase family protein [Nocardioidaceae bacterium]|nr:cyclopropane-fatty-acyl-phospholipid synthase family protein [Nocardioidaceae bacterium]
MTLTDRGATSQPVDGEVWPAVTTAPQAPLAGAVAGAIFRRAVRRVPVRVTLPDGRQIGAGDAGTPEMVVRHPGDLYARLGADLRIGFGEAYMAGDWAPGPGTDLADLLTPFAARLTRLVPKPLQHLRGLVDQRLPSHEANTVEGARDNISRHYDLSNDLFAAFLDPTMTYSAGWFADLDSPDPRNLEAAQLHKIDGILDYAGVTDGTRVLEIGTGWGALAIRAARRGAHVTSVTISSEQRDLAQQRIADAGVSDSVDVRLQDYREVEGRFDAVVSVEMIEAVGEEFWPTYFTMLDRVLAPGGRVGLQAITMDHDRMLATRRSYGWIQKYIFPGGLIPSLQAINDHLDRYTRLTVVEQRELGRHYAETLHHWRDRFLANWPHISGLGFDDTFRRLWEFYLAYCEAGFRTGYLKVRQLSIAPRPAS